MNEEKIKELFELCLRVSNETSSHVSFEYAACDDMSKAYIYIFDHSGKIVEDFMLYQFFDAKLEFCNYEKIKKSLLEVLINGRCPLNEP